MSNTRMIAKQLFDEQPILRDNEVAWTAWKMAFDLGIEHQKSLDKNIELPDKYRLGRNTGKVILTADGQKEICHFKDEYKHLAFFVTQYLNKHH